ncbi:flavin reductase family protein [Cupriavidus lacunae]|uniref:Flavin reductase n=1 Tax=Cupriavidus lacunae TaxID=2666307 RepID=A0A370NI77_9BURK|nr:flavin reductase family protein [Cupriavidus lacunae]RDK05311.1 flavin reductase [Cupriavidus lacunae]
MTRSLHIDPEEFRKGLRAFTTGVTVVSMDDGHGGMHAMTASSFAAVSVEPQLVAVSVAKTAKSHALLSADGPYAINILGERQAFHGHYFANRMTERWNPSYEWHEGAPVLAGTMGWFVCRRWAAYDGGDHTILVGETLKIHRTDDRPLVCSRGEFHVLGAKVEVVHPDALSQTATA